MSEPQDMNLLLWRHAEAEEGFPDAGRRLTPRGRKQAEKMARWLHEFGPSPLRILVSPARRTVETAAFFNKSYELCEDLGVDGTPSELLTAAGWPDHSGSVLIVGHQPTLGVVASQLLGGSDDSLSFKKGALWWFARRHREGDGETVLKAVISPAMMG